LPLPRWGNCRFQPCQFCLPEASRCRYDAAMRKTLVIASCLALLLALATFLILCSGCFKPKPSVGGIERRYANQINALTAIATNPDAFKTSTNPNLQNVYTNESVLKGTGILQASIGFSPLEGENRGVIQGRYVLSSSISNWLGIAYDERDSYGENARPGQAAIRRAKVKLKDGSQIDVIEYCAVVGKKAPDKQVFIELLFAAAGM